ncbi:uncharacterized protein LOC128638507 isoform X3 [Bombina bombina]|uniref:uncharacterized protein LOC128638507 isoform X3 n=1 Tax=Bombina bombina TaxID=8345 RepID=UPI00235B1798|nr:uncharacterized protein LOC128638507 isoform X3 [Bombina bombina]
MNKEKKRTSEKILSHVLEILYLLTGEASVMQQFTNSLVAKEMYKDKKKMDTMIERILKHTMEIIYLLKGEEYIIVKKDSVHCNIHQVPEECTETAEPSSIEGPKTEPQETLSTSDLSANKSSVIQKDDLDTVSKEGEDEIDDKEILQVKIHSDLYTRLPEENVDIASEQIEDEIDERDILQVNIHSDLYDESINEDEEDDEDGKDVLQLTFHPDSYTVLRNPQTLNGALELPVLVRLKEIRCESCLKRLPAWKLTFDQSQRVVRHHPVSQQSLKIYTLLYNGLSRMRHCSVGA